MTSGVDQPLNLDQQAQPLDVTTLGTTLVLAPHPDDESLGCGGTMALLRQHERPVYVLFVSDGTMSHPHSPTYPAGRLRAVREAEALDALRRLNVPTANARFMRQPDTQVATPDSPGFREAVAQMVRYLTDIRPDTVLVPWRRDPHRDHRATYEQLRAALMQLSRQPRVLEYPIWLWELGRSADAPRPGEVRVWRVAIDTVLDQRNEAIAAHVSQVTRLIDDDPDGFYLSPDLLLHFAAPRELFLESI